MIIFLILIIYPDGIVLLIPGVNQFKYHSLMSFLKGPFYSVGSLCEAEIEFNIPSVMPMISRVFVLY